MWIVDESKLVHHLGAFPLPVEVTPYGSQHLFTKLARRGYNPTWRMLPDNSDKFRTHQRNFIIDLHLEDINDPFALHEELIGMVGLIEDGLFLNQVNDILVGTQMGQNSFMPVHNVRTSNLINDLNEAEKNVWFFLSFLLLPAISEFTESNCENPNRLLNGLIPSFSLIFPTTIIKN